MKRAILPAHRLRLRLGYGASYWIGALVCLGVAAALAVAARGFAGDIGDLRREQQLWERGTPAADGWIDGKRRSQLGLSWVIASYDAKVTYTDDRGERHTGTLAFWTMFGGPDTDAAELRFDPAQRDRFAVSWGVDASGARWRAVIVMTALFALLALTFAYVAWIAIGALRRDRRIAATGDEVELRVVSTKQVMKEVRPGEGGAQRLVPESTGKWQLELELDRDGREPRRMTLQLEWPLYCAPDNARILALADDSRDHLIVLAHDGAPLALSDADRLEVMRRAEAARDGR